MTDRSGIFAGDNPFELARKWLSDAEKTEPNDANAIALASVDSTGLPNVRMVLLKEIEDDSFVFYTNYESAKGIELRENNKVAFVMHWKSLRRQVRVRGVVQQEDGPQADDYYASRSLQSRLGAWASKQSQPLNSRAALVREVAAITVKHGPAPKRPPFWGGFRINPVEIEFWADGAFRLHDRYRWERPSTVDKWSISRLYP